MSRHGIDGRRPIDSGMAATRKARVSTEAGRRWHQLRLRSRLWSISTWIVVICIAVFTLQMIVGSLLFSLGNFNAHQAILGGQLWRVITFQFLHAGWMHIGINLMGLWFFGPMVERRLGRARFLTFYLLCGVGGAAGYVILWQLGLLSSSARMPLIGASAGLFGVIAAAMAIKPNQIINLAIPPIDITVFRFGIVWLILAAFVVLLYGRYEDTNAGGEASHLGGAAVGFLLIRNLRWLGWIDRISPRFLQSPARRHGRLGKSPGFMKYHGWR